MREIKSILVVLDPLQDEQPALQRACLIATGTGSELHLLDSSGESAPRLEELANDLRSDGLTVSIRQHSGVLEHQQIIAAQQEEGCGLVIKQHYRSNPLTRMLLTPDDWKLLRLCPCPVMLVRGLSGWHDQPVLAAVDLDCLDAPHRNLHERIIGEAMELASLMHGPLHVMSIRPASPLSATDPGFALGHSLIEHHHEACNRFCQEQGIEPHQLHVCTGMPDLLIPQMAAQLAAAVTVIGSVARVGLDAALIGNTAESVLEAVEHDVLVLKPESVELRLAQQADAQPG